LGCRGYQGAASAANQLLLLIGGRRGRRPAEALHPFGHAREQYIYAFQIGRAHV